jgi:hypothetical protein
MTMLAILPRIPQTEIAAEKASQIEESESDPQ